MPKRPDVSGEICFMAFIITVCGFGLHPECRGFESLTAHQLLTLFLLEKPNKSGVVALYDRSACFSCYGVEYRGIKGQFPQTNAQTETPYKNRQYARPLMFLPFQTFAGRSVWGIVFRPIWARKSPLGASGRVSGSTRSRRRVSTSFVRTPKVFTGFSDIEFRVPRSLIGAGHAQHGTCLGRTSSQACRPADSR